MKVQQLLDKAYLEFHQKSHRDDDPISKVVRYPLAKDQEVAGLITAVVSYGNVRHILTSSEKLLAPLGKHPAKAILNEDFPKPLKDFRHRFTTGEDIEVFFAWIRQALLSHGSIEKFFIAAQKDLNAPMKNLLGNFIQAFKAQPLSKPLQKISGKRKKQLSYLLSNPHDGSACKRLNMYLRWMVRPNDGIDLGIWKGLNPSQLMLPVDTHLLKVIGDLGWSKSKSATWRVVEAATSELRKYDKNDPIKFDFSLCHLSMNGKRVHSG